MACGLEVGLGLDVPVTKISMIENEPEKPQKGWGCLEWIVVLVVLALAVYNSVPSYGLITARSQQMKGSSHARQITGLLLTYASDNSGHYPDFGKDLSKLTSNQAFHELVKEGLVQDETIFSCPGSPFTSDKDVGLAPDYAKALTPGENHWMLVAGLQNNSPAHYPVVMENAVDATWPPRWMPYPSYISRKLASIRGDKREPPSRGRSWENNAVIIGFNDASVQAVEMDLKDDRLHLPASILKPEGKEPLPTLKILDVEVP